MIYLSNSGVKVLIFTCLFTLIKPQLFQVLKSLSNRCLPTGRRLLTWKAWVMIGRLMTAISELNVKPSQSHGQHLDQIYKCNTTGATPVTNSFFGPTQSPNPTHKAGHSEPSMETQSPMDIAWRFTVETADANKVSHAHIPTNVQNAPSDTPSTAHAPQTQTAGPPSQAPQQTPQKLKSNPALPTPIKPERLLYHLSQAKVDSDTTTYLYKGFTEGFSIGCEKIITDQIARNAHNAQQHPKIVQEKLQNEIRKDRMAGPFPSPPFHTSPLNIREKKTPGRYRLIHDLSFPYNDNSINHNIPDNSKKVQYATVIDAIELLLAQPHGAFSCKTDIADAFRLIPISPDDYPKLGMTFNNQYYYDKVLPQGCASSCKISETFSSALQAIFLHHAPQAACTHMVDDFLIIGPDYQSCMSYLNIFQQICEDIDVPLAPEKTTTPSPCTTFLGIELNSQTRTARLPSDKLQQYQNDVTVALQSKNIRRKNLESLVGKLGFAASVVPARTFLRGLIDNMYSVEKPYHFIHISTEMRKDLITWQHFLSHYNGITFFRACNIAHSDEINMCSDASKSGFGACYGTNWIQAPYPESWQQFHITVLELFPIYVMINVFGNKMRNSNILFMCDNKAVVDIVNKQSSKDKTAMSIIRPLVLSLIKFNINLRCKHIPGILNVLPDRISRFQVSDALLNNHGMNQKPTCIPDHLLPECFDIKWMLT